MKADVVNGLKEANEVGGYVVGIAFTGLFLYGLGSVVKDAVCAKRKLHKREKAKKNLKAVIS